MCVLGHRCSFLYVVRLPLVLTTALSLLRVQTFLSARDGIGKRAVSESFLLLKLADTGTLFFLTAASASSSPTSSSASSSPRSSARTRGRWTSRSLATTIRCVLIPNKVALASLTWTRACTDDDRHAGQAEKGHLHQASRCQGLVCAAPTPRFLPPFFLTRNHGLLQHHHIPHSNRCTCSDRLDRLCNEARLSEALQGCKLYGCKREEMKVDGRKYGGPR